MILNNEMETLTRPDLETLQLRRLKQTVELCYENVPHYRQAMDEVGFRPEHLKTLKDVSNTSLLLFV